jgi:hypothetical protein
LPHSLSHHHPPQALFTTPQVLVRRDGHVPPLSPLYDGPYTVLHRSPTHFTLQFPNSTDTVSINRLKPFHSPQSSPPLNPRPSRGRPRSVTFQMAVTNLTAPSVLSPPPATSRSGRPLKQPQRLSL